MKKFYIIQMIDGFFIGKRSDARYTEWTENMIEAMRFDSKKEAIDRAPSIYPFRIIKFYDK